MQSNETELELMALLGTEQSARDRFVPVEARGHSPALNGIHVHVKGVSKSFGALDVLRDVDMQIEPGEFVAIVGRSGCGKSTLLRLLTGLDGACSGDIEFDSVRQSGLNTDVRIMFQDARLLPWKTVFDNVALGLPVSSHAHARQVLSQVGLSSRADDWPSVLSGGQRQRVALARALVHEPRLLLLDEPLGALDALTRIEMQALIERLWTRHGFTALLVTHDVQEAIALADRVILIDNGRIALDQRVDLPRPRQRGTAEFAELEGRVLSRVLNEIPLATTNQFRGQVTEIVSDPVVSEVRVLTGLGTVTSMLPSSSVRELNLEVGDEVVTSFPATKVAFARGISGVHSDFLASAPQSG